MHITVFFWSNYTIKKIYSDKLYIFGFFFLYFRIFRVFFWIRNITSLIILYNQLYQTLPNKLTSIIREELFTASD
jgi:hypothetical protein